VASPSASSSGSVVNSGIQVMSGSFMEQSFGDGIQCAGSTLTFTPFLNGVDTHKLPYEPFYNENIYDERTNDDGSLLNPGHIIYQKPIRTGQPRKNLSYNYGFSLTVSVPLDRKLSKQCKRAANARIAMIEQVYHTKRLDFELSRMKVCAEQKKLGVTFAKSSDYYKICEDIILLNPPNTLPNHQHSIGSFSAVSDVQKD